MDHNNDADADDPGSPGTIAFIGSLRGNTYRVVAAGPLANASFASIGVDKSFVKSSGPGHRRAAEHYSEAMMRSTFCLHLPGDTITSRRIFDAINAGCVPVIVTGAGSKPGLANVTLNKVYPQALDPTPAGRKFRREMTFVNLPFSVRLSLGLNERMHACHGGGYVVESISVSVCAHDLFLVSVSGSDPV